MNKKGLLELGQLTGIVMVLVIITVLLTVGLRTTDGLAESVDDTTRTIVLANETTGGVINETGNYPNSYSPPSYRGCVLSVTRITNQTGDGDTGQVIISSGNYTIAGCKILYASKGVSNLNNTLWNVTGSLTYKSDTIDYNASQDAKEGIINISDNQGLLGTVIIFGVIISVVVIAFMVKAGGF